MLHNIDLNWDHEQAIRDIRDFIEKNKWKWRWEMITPKQMPMYKMSSFNKPIIIDPQEGKFTWTPSTL